MRGKMKTFYKLMLSYKAAQGKQIRGFHSVSGRKNNKAFTEIKRWASQN